MRSSWITGGPKCNDRLSHKKREIWTQREEHPVMTDVETGVMRSRIMATTRGEERGMGQFSLWAPEKEPTPLTP